MAAARTVRVLPIAPGGVHGTVRVPPSKSLTQRAVIAAAVAGAGSQVRNPLEAEDPRLLVAALAGAGWDLEWSGGAITVRGFSAVPPVRLDLGNNGTGVRFALAQLAATPGRFTLDGSARLRARPMAGLVAALRALGGSIRPASGEAEALPFAISGRDLAGGEVTLDASASSQFASALMLLAPRLAAGLTVRLQAPPPSRPYLDLTSEVLTAFGGRVRVSADGLVWAVSGGPLRPFAYDVEGDWSAAAFPLAAVAVAGGAVTVAGVRRASRQGDAVVLPLLIAAGCEATWTDDGVRVTGPARRFLAADLRDTPDLFPALAAVAAVTGGRLVGLAGLAHKESPRLEVMAAQLASLGFDVTADGDSFAASPAGPRAAPEEPLDPAADHRVAMGLAVAALAVPGARLAGPACVAKSWPGFWRVWEELTGSAS